MNKSSRKAAKGSTKKGAAASIEPTIGSIDPFFNRVHKDDDFARIVVGAAKVDACVTALLENFLVDCSTKQNLLSHKGAAGDFSTRATLCYTLGLISKLAYSDMNILANLRNESAHNHNKLTFRDEGVREKIAGLKWVDAWFERNYGQNDSLVEFFAAQLHEKYNTTIALLCCELDLAAKRIEKRTPYLDPLSMLHVEILDANGEALNDLPAHLKARRDAAAASSEETNENSVKSPG